MNFFSSSKNNVSVAEGKTKPRHVTWAPGVIDDKVKYGSLRTPVMIQASELINVSSISCSCSSDIIMITRLLFF
jgi:hypothetical protein